MMAIVKNHTRTSAIGNSELEQRYDLQDKGFLCEEYEDHFK